MSTSQSSTNLLRKSAKTCDKSNKPKNTLITTTYVHIYNFIKYIIINLHKNVFKRSVT